MMMQKPAALLLSSIFVLAAAHTAVAQETCAVEVCRSVPGPPPCTETNQAFDDAGCPEDFNTNDMDFCFSDTVPDGSAFPSGNGSDGQIFVRGDQDNGNTDCGTIRVKETGYYALFDSELSESCSDQLDETGYLTVHNSCNEDGWATTRNVGDRFLVEDQDNEGAGCEEDAECGAGRVCREGNSHGRCCVPVEPVFMGTFMLVAGEENVVCLHHWCPEWRDLSEAEPDTYQSVFVHDDEQPANNCVSADSIHFLIAATAVACRQEGYLQACTAGCDQGECVRHPCDTVSCPEYCEERDGEAACVGANPCERVSCEYGCAFGLCLQGPDARGEDGDGDDYVDVSDCDDQNANVHPGHDEVCENGLDDDCDGLIDECGRGTIPINPIPDPTPGAGGQAGASSTGSASKGSGSGDDGGCGCRTRTGRTPSGLAFALIASMVAVTMRRRRERR
jgi:hypothetical protein